MKRKAFVLLSGGLDSTTCLYKAIHDFAPTVANPANLIRQYQIAAKGDGESYPSTLQKIDWVEAISVDYGQRHVKESECAAHTCGLFGIPHSVLPLPDVLSGKGVMLTDPSVQVPDISYSEIKGVSPTYVPFRNGALLSVITAYAQKWVNTQIDLLVCQHGMTKDEATWEMRDSAGVYFGAHSEDAANWAYPDCTPEFIGAMANAINIGTYGAVRLYTPLQWLMKDEIVELGDKLDVDFSLTWSCYKGETHHCGTCPTCRSRKEAFKKADIHDPTVYADELESLGAAE